MKAAAWPLAAAAVGVLCLQAALAALVQLDPDDGWLDIDVSPADMNLSPPPRHGDAAISQEMPFPPTD